jgi:hypothetical protein
MLSISSATAFKFYSHFHVNWQGIRSVFLITLIPLSFRGLIHCVSVVSFRLRPRPLVLEVQIIEDVIGH